VNLFILVKYGPDGEPVLDMGGQYERNARRRVFTNEKTAQNYARKVGGATVVAVELGCEGGTSSVVGQYKVSADRDET
jgi:hypothetical protein